MLLYTDIQLLCYDWTQSDPTFVLGESEVPHYPIHPPKNSPLEQPELCVLLLKMLILYNDDFLGRIKMQISKHIFLLMDSNFPLDHWRDRSSWFPIKITLEKILDWSRIFEGKDLWPMNFSLMLLLKRRQRFFLVPAGVNLGQNRGWPRVLALSWSETGSMLSDFQEIRSSQSIFSSSLVWNCANFVYWFHLFITRALYSPSSAGNCIEMH